MTLRSYNTIKQATAILVCGLLALPLHGQQRTMEDILEIATRFSKKKELRSESTLQLRAHSKELTPDARLTDRAEAYYLFTAPKEQTGFIIVSGDERMPEVLAYSDENEFDVNNIPPNVKYWLQTYVEEYIRLQNARVRLYAEGNIEVLPDGVQPLLGNNTWGQEDPFNRLCPMYRKERCVVGCVATAMAQVMRYYSYPEYGSGSSDYWTQTLHLHVQRDFSQSKFLWELMPASYQRVFSDDQAKAVAELMYSCGASVQMDYGPASKGGSGAYQHALVQAFVEHFHYDKDAAILERDYCSTQEWQQLLVNELNQGHPVNYAGVSRMDGGHSFVLDGYRVSSMSKYPDYHVNWGWNGSCNGYYQIANLNPDGYNFSSYQQMLVGIKPEDGIDSNRNILCSEALTLAETPSQLNGLIRVRTSSIYNASYQTFDGELAIGLIGNDRPDTLLLGAQRMKKLPFYEELEGFSIEAMLPDTLTGISYTLKLFSRSSSSKVWHQVYSSKYPTLGTSAQPDEEPIHTSPIILACNGADLPTLADKSIIQVQLYELRNLQLNPFRGYLRLLLTDLKGRILTALGDSVPTKELGYDDIETDRIKLSGSLTNEWADGHYKLYIGAKNRKELGYSFVKQYNYALPREMAEDMSFDVEIANGCITINGNTYQQPTRITNHYSSDISQKDQKTYSLDGQEKSPSYGINIVRQPNGTYRKLLIR